MQAAITRAAGRRMPPHLHAFFTAAGRFIRNGSNGMSVPVELFL
jgi:hypothetical protein